MHMRLIVGLLLLTSPMAYCHEKHNQISNPGFERARGTQAEGWRPFEAGYDLDREVKRSGSVSIRCSNESAQDRRGATYTIQLNQKQPEPLLIVGWSRAENVSGFLNNDYSLYVDLEHMDGTPLWGQTAPFSVGTHEWQRKQVLIVPSKPLKVVHIHALFRYHTGTVWFDDFSAVTLSGNALFDSQAIAPPKLKAGVREGRWFFRDVAAGSPLMPLTTETLSGIRLVGDPRKDASRRTITVQDTTGKPRAITVYYVERFEANNVRWWNDIRHSDLVGTRGERANLTRVGNYGATGAMSLYPFGCVTGGGRGRMVGVVPLTRPNVSRIGYHAGERLLYVAFDVALVGENRVNSEGRGRGRTTLTVFCHDIAPEWGFRAAALTYYRQFPAAFDRRAKAEGIWIPFTDPAVVERVQDFHVAYHEGDNSIESDDRLGILSFRYTEPMTWWMPMPKEASRNYETALQMLKDHLKGSDPNNRSWAQTVLHSGSYDENGWYNVEFVNAPWTNGAVWVLNPNPAMPHPMAEKTKATHSYTKEMADRMFGPGAKGTLDGEYLDSIEGWADVLDFRPESLRYAQICPTFTTDTHRPVIPTWFSVWEFTQYVRADLRTRNRLLMANATPWRIHAFLPLLDIAGTETNWHGNGRWLPDSDAVFNLRRTLSYRKPYLLLQNTDFNQFGPELVEKYFQRSMFYGVYPSMFSIDASTDNYWNMPKWYNRDRHLFVKYIPVIKALSAAGWEPITHARSDNSTVYLERFGNRYLTVFNDASVPAQATISLDIVRFLNRQGASGRLQITDMVSGETLTSVTITPTTKFSLTLKPEEGRALKLVVAR